jgi:hypothetical protein
MPGLWAENCLDLGLAHHHPVRTMGLDFPGPPGQYDPDGSTLHAWCCHCQCCVAAACDAQSNATLVCHLTLPSASLALCRYITDPEERDEVQKGLDSFVQAVTGKK